MRRILLFIYIILISPNTFGQDSVSVEKPIVKYDYSTGLEPVNFNEEKIESYKSDKAFNYLSEVKNDSWWTRFKRWIQMKYQQLIDWLFGEYEANSVLAFLLQVLPYLIIGALLGLIVWLFIRLNPGPSLLEKPEDPEVIFDEEEKIVRSQNIPALIEAAIRNGNYRLAVRYYYLQLLKELSEKGFITYEFQKTNTEYLNEINDEALRRSLKQVMRIYDFIWYGSFTVSEKDFAVAQNSFRDLETSITRTSNEK